MGWVGDGQMDGFLNGWPSVMADAWRDRWEDGG